MRPVRTADGKRYLLVKRSADASLVYDPSTGDETYVGTDRLEPIDDVTGLETAAEAIPGPVRRLLGSVHDERTLGLLVELTDRGPLGVRTLIEETSYCESDLAGTLGSLTAAGLIVEVEVDSERGYAATEETKTTISTLRRSATE
ncbi:DUF7346 family protein [Halovivax cerinus]|uniref:Transcriptional regulator n=1 Tax=Halovivax cerinus TaxID=1487865 RepID=A0ABD5NKC6_9EURY|nr:hypothetical protein [Halovivax cerinus]